MISESEEKLMGTCVNLDLATITQILIALSISLMGRIVIYVNQVTLLEGSS